MRPRFDLEERNIPALLKQFNDLPCFRGSGARLTYIGDEFREVRIEIPLNTDTRNFVGTVYGGSMYSATDAVYMLMLWYSLGSEYLLLDRDSKVRYLRPGTTNLHVKCTIEQQEICDIMEELKNKSNTTRQYTIEIIDERSKKVCQIDKTIYIRKSKS